MFKGKFIKIVFYFFLKYFCLALFIGIFEGRFYELVIKPSENFQKLLSLLSSYVGHLIFHFFILFIILFFPLVLILTIKNKRLFLISIGAYLLAESWIYYDWICSKNKISDFFTMLFFSILLFFLVFRKSISEHFTGIDKLRNKSMIM